MLRVLLFILFWSFSSTLNALAQEKRLLRDAGIEYAMRQIAAPISAATGLSPENLKIYLVNDRRLNAQALDTQTIVIFSGLLLKIPKIEQFQALLAHEIAHISNGHHARRLNNLDAVQRTNNFGVLLGFLMAGGGAGPYAAIGATMGTAIVASENFFAHTRAEEASADHSAMRYLMRIGQHPQALYDMLKIIDDKTRLNHAEENQYATTHPLSAQRLRTIEAYILAQENIPPPKPQPIRTYWFERMKVKLSAYLGAQKTSSHPPESELDTLFRATRAFRYAQLSQALSYADKLTLMRPDDAFYHALRGKILRKSKQSEAAIKAYQRALSLNPDEALFSAGLGRAYLEYDTDEAAENALLIFEKLRTKDPSPTIFRNLGKAYSRTGNHAMAAVSAAELYASLGEFETARLHARKALDTLNHGSTGWLRAQDILRKTK